MQFGKWPANIHDLPDQKKRAESARKSGMTPISIDAGAASAVFAGSGKSPYETTLDSCTCSDFVRRKLPCKHIYRLAAELGLSGEPTERGMNRFAFSTTLDSLSDDAKIVLYKIAGASSPVLLKRGPETEELVLKSLCVESIGNYAGASGTSTYDFREAIKNTGVSFPSELLEKGRRVKSMLSELQRMYEGNPQKIESLFIVLEPTPQVSENVNVINRRFSSLFNERFGESGAFDFRIVFK